MKRKLRVRMEKRTYTPEQFRNLMNFTNISNERVKFRSQKEKANDPPPLYEWSKLELGIPLFPFQEEIVKRVQAKRFDSSEKSRGNKTGVVIDVTPGYGKTFITIQIIINHYKKFGSKGGATLIVCPKNIITQFWKDLKFQTNFPSERIFQISTSNTQIESIVPNAKTIPYILFIPYRCFSIAVDKDHHSLLEKDRFKLIVFDEAHVLCNTKTKLAGSALRLIYGWRKRKGKTLQNFREHCSDKIGSSDSFRLLLTGTSIRNAIEDLMIYAFITNAKADEEYRIQTSELLPGIHPAKEEEDPHPKKKRKLAPIGQEPVGCDDNLVDMCDMKRWKRIIDALANEQAMKNEGYVDLFEDLDKRKRISSFYSFLNRYCVTQRRAEEIDMFLGIPSPESTMLIFPSDALDNDPEYEFQSFVYKSVVSNLRNLLKKNNKEHVIEQVGYAVNALLHPASLFYKSVDGGQLVQHKDAITNKRTIKKLYTDCRKQFPCLMASDPINAKSYKIDQIINIVQRIREGGSDDKIVILSRSARFLPILKAHLVKSGTCKQNAIRIYDSTFHPNEKEKILSDFRTKPEVFIFLTTHSSGGVGLNLQEANHVVHADLAWTNAEFDQGNGRVQRPNQQKNHITIWILLMEDSIDMWIASINFAKYAKTTVLREGKKNLSGIFTKKELQNLFKMISKDKRSKTFSERTIQKIFGLYAASIRETGTEADLYIETFDKNGNSTSYCYDSNGLSTVDSSPSDSEEEEDYVESDEDDDYVCSSDEDDIEDFADDILKTKQEEDDIEDFTDDEEENEELTDEDIAGFLPNDETKTNFKCLLKRMSKVKNR